MHYIILHFRIMYFSISVYKMKQLILLTFCLLQKELKDTFVFSYISNRFLKIPILLYFIYIYIYIYFCLSNLYVFFFFFYIEFFLYVQVLYTCAMKKEQLIFLMLGTQQVIFYVFFMVVQIFY
jgi:hypothetical protein